MTTDLHLAPKILNSETLAQRIRHWRAVGGKIVFTNGCFDILHRGHVELLSACRKYGDYVVLGLNSDASVSRLKGPERPVNDQDSRAIVLAALSLVDAIVIFDEDTPADLITAVRPDILVKGGDYIESEIAGATYVRGYGGEVKIVPLVPGISTTFLLSRGK